MPEPRLRRSAAPGPFGSTRLLAARFARRGACTKPPAGAPSGEGQARRNKLRAPWPLRLPAEREARASVLLRRWRGSALASVGVRRDVGARAPPARAAGVASRDRSAARAAARPRCRRRRPRRTTRRRARSCSAATAGAAGRSSPASHSSRARAGRGLRVSPERFCEGRRSSSGGPDRGPSHVRADPPRGRARLRARRRRLARDGDTAARRRGARRRHPALGSDSRTRPRGAAGGDSTCARRPGRTP